MNRKDTCFELYRPGLDKYGATALIFFLLFILGMFFAIINGGYPNGEDAVLKTVGQKWLEGSNPLPSANNGG